MRYPYYIEIEGRFKLFLSLELGIFFICMKVFWSIWEAIVEVACFPAKPQWQPES